MIPIIGPILEALNFFTLMMMFITLSLGIGLGLFLTAYLVPAARVMYCKERDKRGLELNVEEEDPISFKTKSKPQLMFWKWGGSYEFPARFGKKISTFLGKEGTAYSWVLQGFHTLVEYVEQFVEDEHGKRLVFEEVEVPKTIELEFESLEEVVEHKWGTNFYVTVPDEKKELLREDKLLVTVGLEPGMTPAGFKPITETDIEDAGDRNFLALWAKGVKGVLGTPIGDRLMTMGAGGLITLVVCILMGWIKIVGTT